MKPTALPNLPGIFAGANLRHVLARAVTDIQADAANHADGKSPRAGLLLRFLDSARSVLTPLATQAIDTALTVVSAVAAADGKSFLVTYSATIDIGTVQTAKNQFNPITGVVLADRSQPTDTTVRYWVTGKLTKNQAVVLPWRAKVGTPHGVAVTGTGVTVDTAGVA